MWCLIATITTSPDVCVLQSTTASVVDVQLTKTHLDLYFDSRSCTCSVHHIMTATWLAILTIAFVRVCADACFIHAHCQVVCLRYQSIAMIFTNRSIYDLTASEAGWPLPCIFTLHSVTR